MAFPVRTAWYSRPGWSEFGRVGSSGITHKGHDIYVPAGTSVYATGPGIVTAVRNNPDKNNGFGLNVEIKLDNGCRTLDAHFEKVYVNIGQRVTDKTRIGKVGNTGNAWDVFWYFADLILSHDHHQVWNAKGQLIDPIAYHGVSPAGELGEEIDMATPQEIWGHSGGSRTVDGIKTGVTSTVGHLTTASAMAVANRARLIRIEAKLDALALSTGVNPESLAELVAARVEAQLEDDFAAIHANIDDQPTEFEITPKAD